MARNCIGVDISKDWLDVHDLRRGEVRIDNTALAIRRWLGGLDPDAFLVMEGEEDRKTIQWIVFPTNSRCDRLLRTCAEAAGTAHTRVNPLYSWHYAQSCNLAKTDRVDARKLAHFGVERKPERTAPTDPARAGLGLLNQRRDQLKRMQTQEKNRLADTTHALPRRDIRASLGTLAGRIARIEAAIRDHLQHHPELSAQAELLCTIPGIGHVTAVELLAHLPQPGQLDRRAIAQLGGLAPRSNDSGKHKGRRYLAPGRRHIRKALYPGSGPGQAMAALSGLRHPHLFGSMATRLREARKPGKVIAIALARKILTIANTIMRTGEPFKVA